MNPREERGLALADAAKISRNGKGWVVPSQAGRGRYTVTLNGDSPRCTCPDHEIRGQKCKHIYAVEYTLENEVSPNGETTVTETVTETVKITYKQNWPAYNAAQTEEKHRFAMLLSELCKGISEPEQTMGRPRLPLGDMVFASTYKVYVGFSSRRFTSDLLDAHSGGLIRSTPHFNSVSRYLSNPELTEILKNLVTISSLPLKAVETDFAVDSLVLLSIPLGAKPRYSPRSWVRFVVRRLITLSPSAAWSSTSTLALETAAESWATTCMKPSRPGSWPGCRL